MKQTLLERTRKINQILQDQNLEKVSFENLSESLSNALEANVYILTNDGQVLGKAFKNESYSPIIQKEGLEGEWFPESYMKNIGNVNETVENITGDELESYFEEEVKNLNKFVYVLPIFGNGERLGHILFSKDNVPFDEEELVLCEIAVIVVALEVVRDILHKREIDDQEIAVVEKAIATLSYSEIEAVQCIFSELQGEEGVLVASKIADRAGITRSVIVNALRKFESAGVIYSRSLGMKGTRIKVLNSKLKPMLRDMK